jgi:hypothetical protein
MPLYPPHEPFLYPTHQGRRLADSNLADGLYAYAQDGSGNVWVVPDQPHIHPKILGLGMSAMYAGDLSIVTGEVSDITNLSGTFQCDDPAGLLAVANRLIQQGLPVRAFAVRLFPADGSSPRVLR